MVPSANSPSAREEDPAEWEKALAAVEAADRRHGFTGPDQERSAA